MNMIESRQNAAIKHASSLHCPKNRAKYQEFIAEGERVCQTLISAGFVPIALYAVLDMYAQADALKSAQRPIVVSQSVMEKLSPSTSPSGIIGIFKIPKTPQNPTLKPGLVCANIHNPGNLGTLIRSCAAMGYTTIVTVDGTDPWGPKVIQASAGTIGLVTVLHMTWEQLIAARGSLSLYALVAAGGQSPASLNLSNALFVAGNEAHGIPNEWIDMCDQTLTLPMPGNTESLNVATAASIVLYIAATNAG